MKILNASGCLDALTAPAVARSLDAFVTKSVTPLPREGNAPPRIAEVEHGMLNSIGLANPGIDRFLAHTLPRLRELEVPIWVSVGEKAVDPRIRQPDRVEHSVLDLGDPGRRIPLAWQRRHAFRDERIQGARHRRRSQGIEAARGVQDLHAATASAASTGPSTPSRLISPSICTA